VLGSSQTAKDFEYQPLADTLAKVINDNTASVINNSWEGAGESDPNATPGDYREYTELSSRPPCGIKVNFGSGERYRRVRDGPGPPTDTPWPPPTSVGSPTASTTAQGMASAICSTDPATRTARRRLTIRQVGPRPRSPLTATSPPEC
jgi:hypothetical protein